MSTQPRAFGAPAPDLATASAASAYLNDDLPKPLVTFLPLIASNGHADRDNIGVMRTDTGRYQVLGSGDTIEPSSTFLNDHGGSFEVKFRAGVDGYVGVSVMNEQTGEIT